MTEERDDIVILLDENGEEVEFEHLDTIEFNGNEYVVLLPLVEDEEDSELEDEDASEVVILRIEHGEDEEDEDSFISIEDEAELSAVFEEFKSRFEDDFNFSDE